MKLHNECIVCLFKQVLDVGKTATDDREKIKELLDSFALKIPELNFEQIAPEIVEELNNDLKRKLNTQDPYQDFKEKHMQLAHKIYPHAKKMVENSKDKIQTALLLAATGNSIDAGISNNIDIENIFEDDVKNGFIINDIKDFEKSLADSKKLVIIADNSGEGYFDKILIEEINQMYDIEIYYAVRSEPVINDITAKEAAKIGINEVAHIIDSGSKAPGLLMKEATEEFKNILHESDITISKGQGNYESISEENIPVYYLLKAKCEVIASHFGIKKGGLIFQKSN